MFANLNCQSEVVLKLIENGCDISGNVDNFLVQTNMNMLQQNALLIHNAIDSVQNIYEDFTKELIPFLIRSDFPKPWKQKLIDALYQKIY